MTLHGGSYAQHTQKAAFQFRCDHKIQEASGPQFLWEWNGTHTFEWKNKYACPVAQKAQPPDPVPDPDHQVYHQPTQMPTQKVSQGPSPTRSPCANQNQRYTPSLP
ncbi:hypothetical protein BD779DRAFT_1508699, partial [Infundibulicybe gibba]